MNNLWLAFEERCLRCCLQAIAQDASLISLDLKSLPKLAISNV